MFDPMGWATLFLVRGKFFLRTIWRDELTWDQPIPPALAEEFRAWTKEAEILRAFQVARCYDPRGRRGSERHLHVFGDASEKAFAAAAYLQAFHEDGTSTSTLLTSKSRVAPKKAPSMPRMELLAALLGARLRDSIEAAMPDTFARTFLYTDSSVAFYWITNADPRRYHQFVANRDST